jgi:hypothetical protein
MCRLPRPDRTLARARRSATVLEHPGEVEREGALDSPERDVDRPAGRHAARKVWD